MKNIVLIGTGKKSLIDELLKKNSKAYKEDDYISLKEERKNKLMVETKKLIEKNTDVFVD